MFYSWQDTCRILHGKRENTSFAVLQLTKTLQWSNVNYSEPLFYTGTSTGNLHTRVNAIQNERDSSKAASHTTRPPMLLSTSRNFVSLSAVMFILFLVPGADNESRRKISLCVENRHTKYKAASRGHVNSNYCSVQLKCTQSPKCGSHNEQLYMTHFNAESRNADTLCWNKRSGLTETIWHCHILWNMDQFNNHYCKCWDRGLWYLQTRLPKETR